MPKTRQCGTPKKTRPGNRAGPKTNGESRQQSRNDYRVGPSSGLHQTAPRNLAEGRPLVQDEGSQQLDSVQFAGGRHWGGPRVAQSVFAFPVSRSLGNEKPGNLPKPSEGTGFPVSRASSRISQVGKPKSDQLKRRPPAKEGAILAENPAGSRKEHRDCPSRLGPALKSWLDNLIIPSLVQRYLLEREEFKAEAPKGDICHWVGRDLCST
jgi:hypothetical protein